MKYYSTQIKKNKKKDKKSKINKINHRNISEQMVMLSFTNIIERLDDIEIIKLSISKQTRYTYCNFFLVFFCF